MTVLNAPKIKILCVDDSASIRARLTEIINRRPDMEVVAVASDPIIARELIKLHNPDVLTLDIMMPRMNGLDFLEKLMRLRPMPVVMISSRTQPGSEETRRALELGAHDVIAKPRVGSNTGLEAESANIVNKIRAAAASTSLASQPRKKSAPIRLPAPIRAAAPRRTNGEDLLVIGASTGGTEAIREVLEQLPASSPPVLVVQHMPAGFTRSFAERLNRTSPLWVKEAEQGEPLLQGCAYIAPGDQHLKVERRGSQYFAQLDAGPEVNRHRPSVDVLFHSVAQQAGKRARGALLTGMGKDGAAGLLAMRNSGAFTLAQDEASCIVFGMPREAILRGAASEVAPLEQIADRLAGQASLSRQLRIDSITTARIHRFWPETSARFRAKAAGQLQRGQAAY
ncbi:MAG: chemotaxis response regulator protein-glutamate methylesterase [Lamprobacter sp.]|uniref:protein-glutamate methylesterase/protein-glutamine glutaminase n=1 Tax=Lamprobacter sp. TaxID=3100796 RepID=UPI002B258914|nr:chemotaxis response regulator protein-glutamate methylesterase [Lamprobacter sp.]MEA3639099.1 chemotaxis response regulator protein-glutamate methylesterase [Lamprobacter sp.]